MLKAMLILGVCAVVLGLIMVPLPGPGVPVVIAGVLLLLVAGVLKLSGTPRSVPDASRHRVVVRLVVTAATGLVIAALAAGSLFGQAVHVQVIGSGRPGLGGGGFRNWSSQTCEVVMQDGRRDVMQSLGC